MMMATWHRDAMLIAILGLLVLCTLATPLQAAEEKQYAFTTIRGKLSNPETGNPMVSARLRFTPTDPDAPVVETETDENGNFEARGLGFGIYAVEIETADGEMIRGVSALPISEGKPVEVLLKLSDKVRSYTSIENSPDRFMAVVTRERKNWPRFWKQFGIFLGLTVATGLAVF
jgi:hypothetical protein